MVVRNTTHTPVVLNFVDERLNRESIACLERYYEMEHIHVPCRSHLEPREWAAEVIGHMVMQKLHSLGLSDVFDMPDDYQVIWCLPPIISSIPDVMIYALKGQHHQLPIVAKFGKTAQSNGKLHMKEIINYNLVADRIRKVFRNDYEIIPLDTWMYPPHMQATFIQKTDKVVAVLPDKTIAQFQGKAIGQYVSLYDTGRKGSLVLARVPIYRYNYNVAQAMNTDAPIVQIASHPWYDSIDMTHVFSPHAL